MNKKPRIRVRPVKGGLYLSKNTQVALYEPGYFVDGKWQPALGEEMKEFNKFKEWLALGKWYENFWNKNELGVTKDGVTYRTHKPRVRPELTI
jgi:hypothetical protein